MEAEKIKEISTQELLKAGSEVFAEQLIKMTKDKIIAHYSLVEHYRSVIDVYRKFFTDYKNGKQIDAEMLTEAQIKLNFAIDHAKVNDLPSDDLEALKDDINYLKYELI